MIQAHLTEEPKIRLSLTGVFNFSPLKKHCNNPAQGRIFNKLAEWVRYGFLVIIGILIGDGALFGRYSIAFLNANY